MNIFELFFNVFLMNFLHTNLWFIFHLWILWFFQDFNFIIILQEFWMEIFWICHKIKFLYFSIFSAYIGWGLLLSLQPPFYPSEAEKKGATPSQYGFVFGIANLAAFLFAPFFGRYGSKIGPKILYNFGAFTQGFVGITFGFLVYIENAGAFLGLSYLLRFVKCSFFAKKSKWKTF